MKNKDKEWFQEEYFANHAYSSLYRINLEDEAKTHPYFFETGTNMGFGVKEAIKSGFKKIISIDIEERYYNLAKENFTEKKYPNTEFTFACGNSAEMTESLISSVNERILFWLDGHGCGRNPLHGELEAIKNHKIKNHTILIDDVRMMGNRQKEWEFAWGPETRRDKIIESVMKINSNYKISYLNSPNAQNDVLVAEIE